jgi:hypothetical protein
MEGLVAHGMAREGSSSAFAPRLRAAVEADGACVVKCRVKWAVGSGALSRLEEGVESGGLDRACRANVTTRVVGGGRRRQASSLEDACAQLRVS